jgi:hypothetical protein
MSSTTLLPVPLALEPNIALLLVGPGNYRVACSLEFSHFHYTPIIPTSMLLCADDAVSDCL